MAVDARQLRRILDLDHNTSLSRLVLALKCLAKEAVIYIRDGAKRPWPFVQQKISAMLSTSQEKPSCNI